MSRFFFISSALVVSVCNANCVPTSKTSTPGNSVGLSHFHVDINGHDVGIDCSMLDSLHDLNNDASGLARKIVGGQSQSTGQLFYVFVPGGASAYRNPGAIGKYPVIGESPASQYIFSQDDTPSFALFLRVLDGTGAAWVGCTVDQCGPAAQDSSLYYHEITEIAPAGSPGTWMFEDPTNPNSYDDAGMLVPNIGVPTATFRVSGRYSALMHKETDTQQNPPTTVATGDWSLLVTVVDVAPPADAGVD
jgi:hypothetical protein